MFDPYHKWLGIPRQEQPPDHYRLLGLSLFESDPDVIDAAANRQMAYLHGCATGTQAPLSQRLLNEVATARLCLLNPEKKAAYDSRLRAKRPVAPKEDVRDRTRPRGVLDDLFPDDEELTRLLESEALRNADEPERPVANIPRPGPGRSGRPGENPRNAVSRRSLLLVSLAGVMFLAVVGYLASRTLRHEDEWRRERDQVGRAEESEVARSDDARSQDEERSVKTVAHPDEVETEKTAEDDLTPGGIAENPPSALATIVREVSPRQKSAEPTSPSPSKKAAVVFKPTRWYPENQFIRVFNGRNFDGWHGGFNAWRIDSNRGVLISPGDTLLHGTGPDRLFDDFVLRFDFRVLSKTNSLFSGLVVRHGDQGVSIAIGDGNSGDLALRKWIDDPGESLNQTKLDRRFLGFNTLIKASYSVENALGYWNNCQVVCDKSEITISINGLTVNQILKADPGSGKIYFTQSGTKAEYRDIRIMPIRTTPSQPKGTGRPR